MGGQSKSQIVGYKYSLYAHFIFGAGVADFVSKIWFRDSETIAWEGKQDVSGIININKPNLFGGSSSQGGVVGNIAFMNGAVDQLPNEYQVGFRGALTPAYRMVMGIVWQDLQIGMNPYLPTWGVEWSRIHKRMSLDGLTDREQWYDEKSGIPRPSNISLDDLFTDQHWDYKWYPEPLEITLANINKGIDIDLTGWTVNQDKIDVPFESAVGEVPFDNDVASAEFPCETRYLEELKNTVMWYRWNFTPKKSQKLLINVSSLFQCDLWLNGNKLDGFESGSKTITIESNQIIANSNNVLAIRASGGEHGVRPYYMYRLRDIYYTSNGFPIPAFTVEAMPHFVFYNEMILKPIHPYGVGYLYDIHDTEFGRDYIKGVRVTTYYDDGTVSGETSLEFYARNYIPKVDAVPNLITFDVSLVEKEDMNPVHIIREFKTEPWSSARIDESKLPDDFWKSAADTVYDEGLGVTFFYDGSQSIESAMAEVCRHIGAETYQDRKTGEFKIKLIRNDYDIDTIPSFDESSIIDMSKDDTPIFGQLTTNVVVNYTDTENAFVSASITVPDIALAQQQGKDITANLDYKGFTSGKVAGRKAQQMLNTLSKPLQKRRFVVRTSAGKDLNKGDVFKFSWSRENIVSMVMRVTDLNFGNGISNRVMIDAVQDEFAMPDSSFVAPPSSDWTPSFTVPTALNDRLVIEAPYLELVQLQGQSIVDLQLNDAPESSYVLAAAGLQSNAIKAMMYDGVSSYVQVGILDFCPTATLDQDIGYLDETFDITNLVNIEEIEIGSWAQFGNELFRVDAISDNSITVGRGVLDTIPSLHSSGDKIYFWDNASLIDSTEFVEGNTVNVKLLTINPKGQLSLTDAPADSVELVGRPARPYNVANLKLNDIYYENEVEGDLVLTWSNRNRLQQTSGTIYDFTDGNITPESGVTVTFNLLDGDTIVLTHDLVTGTTDTFTSSELSGLHADLILEVYTVRDGLDSYQKYQIPFTNYNSGEFMTFEDGEIIEFENFEKVRYE